jgi:DNA polymerase I
LIKSTSISTEGIVHPVRKLADKVLIYGMSDIGLADTLGITEKEAKTIMKNYFDGYPGIKGYMDEQHRKVKVQGFIDDMFGRKRRLHESIKSGYMGSALRMAGNFPIQSSAGSMLKKAIVDLIPVVEKHDTNVQLQIHDELVFDAPRDIPREAIEEIQKTMENAVKLIVPVKCDVEVSPTRWMDNLKLDEWFAQNA